MSNVKRHLTNFKCQSQVKSKDLMRCWIIIRGCILIDCILKFSIFYPQQSQQPQPSLLHTFLQTLSWAVSQFLRCFILIVAFCPFKAIKGFVIILLGLNHVTLTEYFDFIKNSDPVLDWSKWSWFLFISLFNSPSYGCK